MFALLLCIYRFNSNPLRRKKGKMFIIMTSTNQKHKDAVEHVMKKLQDSGSFVSVDKDMRPGVDLYAKRKDGETYYFSVIRGVKQKSKSVYAAVSSCTWDFVRKNHTKDFLFIAEILNNGVYTYYCYTPIEIWYRTTTPYLHLKCNPLKDKKSLQEFKDSFDVSIPERRYEGEAAMTSKLNILPSILDSLNVLRDKLPAQ